jgi:predicted metal-dependent hydrolase
MRWKTLLADLDDARSNKRLRNRIQRLLAKWKPILGVTLNDWDVRKMEKYWASANNETKHITFNADLAKLPHRYVDYLVLHELVHMRTDGHDRDFYELMDEHMPGWRRMQAKIEEPLTRYS